MRQISSFAVAAKNPSVSKSSILVFLARSMWLLISFLGGKCRCSHIYEPLGPRVRSSQLYDACGHPLLLPASAKRPAQQPNNNNKPPPQQPNNKPPPRPQYPKPTDTAADSSKNKRPRPILKKRDASLASDSRAPLLLSSPQKGAPLKRSGSSAAMLLTKSAAAAAPSPRPSSPPSSQPPTALERVASFTFIATAGRRKQLVKSQSLENTAPQRPADKALLNPVENHWSASTGPQLSRGSSNRKAGRGERRGGGGGSNRDASLREQDEEEELTQVRGAEEDGSPEVIEPSKPKRLMKKLFML